MAGELSLLGVSDRLKQLRRLLCQLPDSITHSDGSYYPFKDFQVGSEWAEATGSTQGSISHTLELVFGSRAGRVANGHAPVIFNRRGSDLEAIVDVFRNHIGGAGDQCNTGEVG